MHYVLIVLGIKLCCEFSNISTVLHFAPFYSDYFFPFLQGDCWICMELMDTSLDKFYKFIYEKLQRRIPESILGKITVAVSK
jgi:hypothetical protein